MKKILKISVNFLALLVQTLIYCRYLKDIKKKINRGFLTTAICPRLDIILWMQSRTLVSAPTSNYQNRCPQYKTNFNIRYPDIFSCSLSCYIIFFIACLFFTHNYEGRHAEVSLPIASSRCRSKLSGWRSESEEIKSPVVKIPPLSVF